MRNLAGASGNVPAIFFAGSAAFAERQHIKIHFLAEKYCKL